MGSSALVHHLLYSHGTDLPQPLDQTDGDQRQPHGFGHDGPFSHQTPTNLREHQGQHGQKRRHRQGATNQKDPKFKPPAEKVWEFVIVLSPRYTQLSQPHQVPQPVLPDLLLKSEKTEKKTHF